MRTLLLCLVLAAGSANLVKGQNPVQADSVETMTEVELRDGTVYYGRIVSETDEELVLVTSSGTEVRVAKDQIRARRLVRGRVSNEGFQRFDPNQSRLMFAPTGRTLDQGSAYLSAYYVAFGFVGYGVTDRVTLAGGSWLIPEAFGELLYVAPKVQLIRRPNSSVSAGVLAGFADGGTAGITYGTWTVGQPDQSVTVGLGFAFGDGELFGKDPIVVLGGEKQVGRQVKLVGEVYALPTVVEGALFIGGVRFFGSRLAADLGLIGGAGDGGSSAFPWVSFAYLFGK